MERDTINSFENLCRIFEMRIKLDNEKGTITPRDVLENYEKYSKKIDNYYNEEFQKDLKSLVHPAPSLEQEEDRLKKLIKLLESRIAKREELEENFYNSTGKYISGLQIIVSDAELKEKKERLSLISKYLETNNEINNIEESINKLKDSLNSEELKREEYSAKNKIMEDELYSTFIEAMQSDEYFKNVNEDDLDYELDKVRISVDETKETLDITKESIGSLTTSGLDEDYSSYVEEAEKNYFVYKNRENILEIYSLVIKFEDDFKLLYAKYEKLNDLITERRELRESLNIEDADVLLSFEKLVFSVIKVLNEEKEVLENISNYDSRIKFKEERLEELNEVNSSVEILAILREYGLIDTYDTNDVEVEDSSLESAPLQNSFATNDEELGIPKLDDDVINETYDPYRIVSVTDYPKTLNVGLAKLKGESVREKVNKKLNPKKEETTFIDINSPKEEVLTFESDTLGKTEESKNENSSNQLDTIQPVWEIPKEENKAPSQEVQTATLPTWNAEVNFQASEMTNQNVSQPSFNDPLTISMPNNPAPLDDKTANNMFWIPVSDTKVESDAFPNINIPVGASSNNNINNNFNFPSIN